MLKAVKKLLDIRAGAIAMTFTLLFCSLFLNSLTNVFAASDGKVYVCKYVGTPDVDETLQTGQNPIEVSVNAVGGATVGSYFSDKQGRSYVLATVPQVPEPNVNDCPHIAAGITPTPTATAIPTPDPTAPSCGPDEHLDLSGTKCLKWELGGAPTPNSGGSNGQVLGASTSNDPKGQVLGASTLGATGSVIDNLGLLLIATGAAFAVTSFYGAYSILEEPEKS